MSGTRKRAGTPSRAQTWKRCERFAVPDSKKPCGLKTCTIPMQTSRESPRQIGLKASSSVDVFEIFDFCFSLFLNNLFTQKHGNSKWTVNSFSNVSAVSQHLK